MCPYLLPDVTIGDLFHDLTSDNVIHNATKIKMTIVIPFTIVFFEWQIFIVRGTYSSLCYEL